MLLTHRTLLSPAGLSSAMQAGMGGIFGHHTGEGSSKEAPCPSRI